MPLYDFKCSGCGGTFEAYMPRTDSPSPLCCGSRMGRIFGGGQVIKIGYPMWIDRMDEIHKAQAQRGERLRYIHPKEVGAT